MWDAQPTATPLPLPNNLHTLYFPQRNCFFKCALTWMLQVPLLRAEVHRSEWRGEVPAHPHWAASPHCGPDRKDSLLYGDHLGWTGLPVSPALSFLVARNRSCYGWTQPMVSTSRLHLLRLFPPQGSFTGVKWTAPIRCSCTHHSLIRSLNFIMRSLLFPAFSAHLFFSFFKMAFVISYVT